MKCLVTGAHGFIGQHICNELLGRGHGVVPFIGDVTRKRDWLGQLEGIDAIFHLAGKNRASPQELWAVNYGSVRTFLEIGVEVLFVCASSFQVYPNGIVVTETMPPCPISEYGKSKLAAEQLLISGNYPAAIVRISNVFGAGCKPYYNSVVATWMDLATKGANLRVDMRASRDLIWVEDVAQRLAQIDSPGMYYVASGRLTPLLEVAEMLSLWSGARIERVDGGTTGPVWHRVEPVTPIPTALQLYWDEVSRLTLEEE